MSVRHADVISSDDEGRGPSPLRAPRRRRRWTPRRLLPAPGLVTVLTTSISMVLSGGVATVAVRVLGGGSAGPEALVPSTAFAVATANLRADATAVGDFANLFPGSPTHGSDRPVDALLAAVFGSGTPSIDYVHDVEPWLGDRVAIAAWMHDGTPTVEYVLQCTDAAAARRGLEHIDATNGGDTQYVIRDGYVVIGDGFDTIQAALDAAAKSPLTANAHWAGDVGALRDGAVATGWLDGSAASSLFEAMGPMSDLGFAGLPSSLLALEHARVAAGVYVDGAVAELDERAVGAPGQSSAPSTLLTDLPDQTIGAMDLGSTASVVRQATQGVVSALSITAAPPVGMMCMGPTPARAFAPPAGMRHNRRLLRSLREARRMARRQAAQCRRHPQPSPPPAPDPLKQVVDTTGLHLPQDGQTLLGRAAVVAYGGMQIGALPNVAIRSRTDNVGAAEQVADRFRDHIAQHTGITPGVVTTGDDLVLATSDAYAHTVATGGSLGTQPLFREAMGGLPQQVTLAAYVDLSRIWPVAGVGTAPVSHLEAAGFWSSQQGAVSLAQLRVIAH